MLTAINTKILRTLFVWSLISLSLLTISLLLLRENIPSVVATEYISNIYTSSKGSLSGANIYSKIPIVNQYAYSTPGLLLLSTHQNFTLTGSFLNFFNFPRIVILSPSDTSGVYAAGQYVKVHTWQEYLNIFHSPQNIITDANGIPILNSASQIDNDGNIIE